MPFCVFFAAWPCLRGPVYPAPLREGDATYPLKGVGKGKGGGVSLSSPAAFSCAGGYSLDNREWGKAHLMSGFKV